MSGWQIALLKNWIGLAAVGRSNGADEFLGTIGLFALLFVGIILVRQIAEQYQEDRYDDPNALFRELCRKHHLGFANKRLLKRLAAAWELEEPALLFVQPERFETENLPLDLRNQGSRLAQLQKRLFGQDCEESTPSSIISAKI
jgi:hypothetical protein